MTTTQNDVGGEWDSDFQVVPPGYYKAFVKSAEAKVSQNGNQMAVLVMSVEDDEYEGVTIYNHLVFKPGEPDNFNNKKRKWFQESAGLQYSSEDNNEVIAKQMVDRKVTIKVRTRKDNQGKERNEICGVHPYAWMSEQKVDDKKLSLGDELDDEFL